ncbi:hypothetical protein GCM10027052_11670 [Parafrigoribacterium mesophilum]|uniref:methyltransferase n=1 Tax=Parafrigoribacterium mesophilum TaxID=433646 RepID=UPI0031FDFE49
MTTDETRNELTGQTWVASGPSGAIGSVHRVANGFTFKLLTDDDFRGVYPTLEAAKGALFASLAPGSERPQFREH